MSKQNKRIPTKDDWVITTERYVAYIDIMGFKDMVAKSSNEDIYNMMKKVVDFKDSSATIDWTDAKSELVRTTTYSDSIMVYSKDSTYASLYSLICTVSALSADLFFEGIPFKGAIAFGKMTLDNTKSIFFGQPLIDAYLLQEELNFYGIIIHGSAEEEIDFHSENTDIIIYTKKYLCPLKNGNSWNLTVFPISMSAYLNKEDDGYQKIIDEMERLFTEIEKMRYRTSGHLRKYIDNTLAYLEEVKKEES